MRNPNFIHLDLADTHGCLLDDPTDYDCWKVVSFSRRHKNYDDPDSYFPADIGLRRRFATGTAFLLDYYEHCDCCWSLSRTGPECRFDTVHGAGILFLDDPNAIKPANRREEARRFLLHYSDWCNGRGYDAAAKVLKVVNDNDLSFNELRRNGDLRELDHDANGPYFVSDLAGMVDGLVDLIVNETIKHGPARVIYDDLPSDVADATAKALLASVERGRELLKKLPHGDAYLIRHLLAGGYDAL